METKLRQRSRIGLWVVLIAVAVVVAGLIVYSRAGRGQEAAPSGTGADKSMAGMPGMTGGGNSSERPTPAGQDPAAAQKSANGETSASVPPTVFVPPERQQTIGVKVTEVESRNVSKVIRAVARVSFDERTTTHIHTKTAGWIEEVFVNFVGQPVKRGQPLFTVYSPDLVASQEEYLLALKAQRELGDSSLERVALGGTILADAALRRLRLWDMSESQIEELKRTGQVSRTITIFSPVNGVVLERAAYHHGRYITPEIDLYTIVDLSSVWLLGQVYEAEVPFVRVGQVARVEFPYGANVPTIEGKVTFISPFLDPKTRTAEVRMEFANRAGALRPDAFYNFMLEINLGRQVVAPAEAVMDTGERQYVFVDVGNGYFEPREVRAGPEVDNGRVVERGLKPGERVVTAANFLIDAESRLRGAFAGMGKPSQAPAQTGSTGPALRVEVTTEPSPAKVGKNRIRVRVLDQAGAPVPDAEVDVRFFMPQMGAMGAMESKAALFPAAVGEYTGEIEILMAWTWETTVTVRKGGKVISVTRTNVTAR